MRSKLILLVIILIFVIHCLSLNFTQDDAFISYRYVENFTQGNGLVFNSGERVEGYTNFLWIILLSIFAQLGLDIILVSKILGIASGCVTLILLQQISQLFLPKKDWLLALFPSVLLTASSAFAYWSISGLETTFFVMMVLVSVYLYLTYPRLWVVSCALSVLIRPEGGLIFGILLLHKLVIRNDPLRKSFSCLAGFVLLLLPFVIFKVFYYGDILPNPFYAKTGLSFEYVKSGLEYFWLFLRHYALWGVLYLVPIFFYKSLDWRGRLLILLVYLYTLYVIIIGGDVLKVHRFFLPILPPLYLLFIICLRRLYAKLKSNLRGRVVLIFLLVSIPVFLFLLPHKWIRQTRAAEKNLVEKMQFIAEYLRRHYDDTSIALTTIGSVSYYLGTEVKVIDMLGLTDKYISQHPEQIEGIAITWKERKYNTQYVLSCDPDFILFSTGLKPSAPAERALLLNSEFRQNYFVVPIFLSKTGFISIFRRKGPYSKENEIFKDTRFVDLFCEGVHLHIKRKRHKEAIEKLKRATMMCPKDFALIYEVIGACYINLGNYSLAEKYLKRAIQVDDWSVMPHDYLATIYQKTGRLKEAKAEKKKVYLYDPNFPW